MGYEAALSKAWQDLSESSQGESFLVRFLADEYSLDVPKKLVLSLACNAQAKDFLAVLLLHYQKQKLLGLPEVTGQWQTFREFSGIEGYAQAFRKRSVEPIIRKYGKNPKGIFDTLERLPGKRVEQADAAIVVEAFENVPVLIELWAPDEEFAPEANILFDKSITRIFCIEDVVVLAGFVAASL